MLSALSLSALALALLSPSSPAAARGLDARQDHDHEHRAARQLPGSWYHPDDHPVHALFKRASADTDGVAYPTVGSTEWYNAYPTEWATPTKYPAEWIAALNKTIAAGLIPNVPVSKVNTGGADGSGVPTYPSGYDPNSPSVCSATYQCVIPGDIWNAPDGYVALSFDDGPTTASPGLSSFLAANNQTATHFMIGSNLLDYPNEFLAAFNAGDDIACHTWSHPYMTTLTNEQVVAELGWTVQLIHNSTGGRLPRFWRPPYGDSDMRTRAIAKEVFGLTTVVWNQDTNDWSLTDSPPGTSLSAINKSMTAWLTNATKTPGLIILEHELSNDSVQAFKNAYPIMKSNKWGVVSLAALMGNGSAYLNAATSSSEVDAVGDIVNAPNATVPSSSSASPAASNTAQNGRASSSPSTTASSTTNAAADLVRRPSAGLALMLCLCGLVFGL
ncbi:Carbohydrate esterase family 4 protein [Mycena chlorophos]|uniref:chitin deacetylase n=1 Tax=Mycena chlorophos TaxID=658473 RepID=A0A8H6SBT6_MYCCL|nr:Carbohydrate esterase family 4 protein [Mycena chlorophos]